MNQRKSRVCSAALNTSGNEIKLGGDWCARQRRSAEEIAFVYVKRTLPLLAELRRVRHRLDAYRNGGPRK